MLVCLRRRKDLAVIRALSVDLGADVFVRDRKGKRAFDGEKGVGAGDDVSNLLKQGQSTRIIWTSLVGGRRERGSEARTDHSGRS